MVRKRKGDRNKGREKSRRKRKGSERREKGLVYGERKKRENGDKKKM